MYLRHYINLCILWATLTKFATVGPYELNWETEQYKCWISQVIAFALLACLQAVNLFWLYLIWRIARDFVFKKDLQDVRSDNEDDDESEGPGYEKEEVQRALEPTAPAVLVNGELVDASSKTEGMRARTKAR